MRLILFLAVLVISLSAHASTYSGDNAIKGTCLERGPVRVCRALQTFYGLTVLDLQYGGVLRNSPDLKVWVRVNYSEHSRQGTFTTSIQPGSDSRIVRITGGCLKGRLGGCDESGLPEMRDLLMWAQQPGYILNALSIDVAFVDGEGRWDTNGVAFGFYHFEFPQN